MLQKKKRVTKDVFMSIMKDGKTVHSPLFSFRFLADNAGPRYACVVPKAVFKKAHDRNSLRRKGYNALRKNITLPPLSGIFFFKKEAKTVDFSEITKEITNLLQKAHFVK